MTNRGRPGVQATDGVTAARDSSGASAVSSRWSCVLSAIGSTAVVTTIAAHLGRIGAFGRLPAISTVAVVAMLAVMAIFASAMRRIGRPMGDIVAAADRVAAGDFDTRVVEYGPPWLRSVARAFNSMTSALQSHDEQRRNLMADIAHELRTPLAVIQGRLEGLLDGVYARDDAHLTELLNDTRVLARLVEDLRTLANAESGVLRLKKEPTDLSLLIHDAVRMSTPEAVARQVALNIEAADLPIVEVDPLRICEVLTNLLVERHPPHECRRTRHDCRASRRGRGHDQRA